MVSALEEIGNTGLLAERDALALADASMATVADLLNHLPKRHEDRRSFDRFPNQATDRAVCARGTVVDAGRRSFGGRKGFFEAVVLDGAGGVFGSGKITCRWFNMPYIHRVIATGQDLIFYGKVKDSNGRLVIDHPEFEILREDDEGGDTIHVERIVPVYRNLTGLTQRRLREIIHLLLLRTDPATLPQPLVEGIMSSRAAALRAVHFPDEMPEAQAALRGFALEEFFIMQLNAAWRRARHRGLPGRVLGRRTALLTSFYHSLPFDLTDAQKRSIREIIADMRDPRPMNRLLQGDVGAGKTFVAMAAMLLAVDSGCQAALMAPTQILAEQHYLTFSRWLEPLGVRLSLRTANRCENRAPELAGAPQIIIGTHALLYDDGTFHDLGLVVIDEQHKFGVAQRAALIGRGTVPDVLVMTATPIPRTLAMTVYGDLDVSVLDGKPPGRGGVSTAVRVEPKQRDVTGFVRKHLAEGRQAYLVYPLVEESEALKAESATEAFDKWKKRLSSFEVGLLHGRLKPEEKERVMNRFRQGDIHALVSTTVIEVGVDVPNATLMILHHAERFGLAQIHQLRGRIGRGGHKGYCVLLTDGGNPEAVEKLSILERSADGFEIAEEDLRLRGPGDVLGTMQSGVSGIRFTAFLADAALLREARALADRVLGEDPLLEGRHGRLRGLLHDESSVPPLPGGA
jgi:ATP-dependent DNA helicase RecG